MATRKKGRVPPDLDRAALTDNFAENSYSPLPTFVDTGTFIVDKDNVEKFMQQAKSQGSGQ